jgi:DNA primase
VDELIGEIKARIDIVELIGSYVALRPAGGERYKACCPFHDEKTPSFYVSRDKGFYKCFGCGKSGDAFRFVQDMESVGFGEAKKMLAERAGVAIPRSRDLTPEQQAQFDERDRLLKICSAATAFFRDQFAGNKGLPARDYARTRGLSPQTLEKFSIGYAPDSWDTLFRDLQNKYGFKPEDIAAAGLLVERDDERGKRYYDRYRHRLMFPIWDAQGRCIAFGGRALEGGQTGNSDAKYINSPEGALFNKSRTLFAWHIARSEIGKRESVLVTEGYMDAIALHEAGFSNAVATLGTALTIQHVSQIARLTPENVFLCFDGDSAGMRAALRTAPLFAQHSLNVRVVHFPGGEDPDTFVKKFGAPAFEVLLSRAPLMSRYRVEMAIAEHDLTNVSDRMEAVRAAAQVIGEVESDIERDSYIAWLAERWAHAEGVSAPARVQMIEAAVRREVAGTNKRQRDEEHQREVRQNRWQAQTTSQINGNNNFGNPGANNAKKWRKREEDDATPVADREEENRDLVETLAHSGEEKTSGVVKAERMLLASLLGNPSWRTRILEQLPTAQWTDETHAEIASALRQLDWNEPVDAATLIETLPGEAGGLVGELMLWDEAQMAATAEIIDDCIARVRGHWAKQVEREMIELIRSKLDSGEPISETERAGYNNALIATKRKTAPSEK